MRMILFRTFIIKSLFFILSRLPSIIIMEVWQTPNKSLVFQIHFITLHYNSKYLLFDKRKESTF